MSVWNGLEVLRRQGSGGLFPAWNHVFENGVMADLF